MRPNFSVDLDELSQRLHSAHRQAIPSNFIGAILVVACLFLGRAAMQVMPKKNRALFTA